MTRLVAAVAMLMAGGGVAAAETEVVPCTEVAPMPDATLRDLRVALTPATDTTPGEMNAAAGSVFPAISKDGETIVQLFLDAEDLSDNPVETVVWRAPVASAPRPSSSQRSTRRLDRSCPTMSEGRTCGDASRVRRRRWSRGRRARPRS